MVDRHISNPTFVTLLVVSVSKMLGGVRGWNNFIYGADELEGHVNMMYSVLVLGHGKLTTILRNSVPHQEKLMLKRK